MSISVFLFGLSLISLILILYIFLINKWFKTKKLLIEKIIMVVLIPICFLTAFGGYKYYSNDMGFSKNNLYLAYKYLIYNDFSEAEKKANKLLSVKPDSAEAIQIKSLVDILSGNYKKAEMNINDFLLQYKVNDKAKKKLNRILDLIKDIQANTSQNSINMDENQNNSNYSEANHPKIQHSINEVINSSISDILPSIKTVRKLDKIVEIEEKLKNNNDIDSLKDDVLKLAVENEDDIEIKKLEVKVALKMDDLDQAKNIVKEIIRKEDTFENRMLLTDIYAQQVRNSLNTGQYLFSSDYNSISNSSDPEIQVINEKIKKLNEQNLRLQEKASSNNNEKEVYKLKLKIEENNKKIAEFEKEKIIIPAKRSINYIIVSKPLFGDKDVLYNLQLAKLYFTIDSKNKAKEFFKKALNRVEKVSTSSKTSELLSDIKDIYEQNSDLTKNEVIVQKVSELVDTISPELSMLQNGNNINEEYKNFIVSYLKYSKIDLFISKIDKSNYPNITAYINVGTDKLGIFRNKISFSKNDFCLEDTNIEISNFEVIKNVSNEINIGLVVDKSGSMGGRPLQDAKAACTNFITNLGDNQKVSIVTFDTFAQVNTTLISEKTILENTINEIEAGGNTNISDGLNKSIQTLQTAFGTKAIILLSDGQDNQSTSEELDTVISTAREEGISIYTVGFGDADEEYLNKVAEMTGGRFFKASNSTELVDIYEILQKNILNNYIVKYTVEKNKDMTKRKLVVKLKNVDGQGEKEYYISQQADVKNETENNIPSVEIYKNQFVLTNVVNGSICKSDLSKGIYIEINGMNIKEGTKIKFGDKLSPDIKVLNNHTIRAKLPTELLEGDYDVIGISKDGEISQLDKALSVYKAGALSEIKVGNIRIKATSINKISTDKYLAQGNVIINDVLRVAGNINITVYNPKSNNEWSTGEIKGNSKIYIVFNQNKKSFIHQMLNGKELLVSNGNFYINATNSDSTLKKQGLFDLDLMCFKLEVGTAEVLNDGLQITITKFGFEDLEELTNKLEERNNKLYPVDGELKLKITSNDVLWKASFDLMITKNTKLPLLAFIAPKKVCIDIDTIDEDKNFEFEGEGAIPFLSKYIESFTFNYKAYSKNIKYPDEIGVKISLSDENPIPLHSSRLVYLTELGIGAGQLYEMIKNNNIRKICIIGMGEIAAGLKAFKLPFIGKVNVISFSDLKAKAQLDFKKLEFTGKLKLLNFELVNGKISYDKVRGFEANANGQIKLALGIADMGVKGKFIITVTNDGFLAESNSEIYFYSLWNKEKYNGAGNAKLIINEDVIIISMYKMVKGHTKSLRISLDKNGSILNLIKKTKIEFNY